MKSNSFTILVLSFVIFFVICDSNIAYSQMTNRQKAKVSKRKNNRISNWRGGIISFSESKRYFSVGFNSNITNYFGDLVPNPSITSTEIESTRLGFGLNINYRYWSNLTVGAALNWNRLYGDDFTAIQDDPSAIGRYTRNLQFRNDLIEFSLFQIFDLIPNRGTFYVRPPVVPYIWAGISAFYHDPKGLAPENDYQGNPLPESGTYVKLRPLGTEGQYSDNYENQPYGQFQIAVPFGAGIRYKLFNFLDLEMEVSYRYTFTDYLDDVSTRHVDLGALDSDLAKTMSNRSAEPTAVLNGEDRKIDELILPESNYTSYISKFDNQEYTVLSGVEGSVRGNPEANDHFIVTSLKIKYIIHGNTKKAGFR